MHKILGLFVLIGVVCAGDIFQTLPAIPNFDDVANVEGAIKDKCVQHGGDKAFKNLKAVAVELQSYVMQNYEFGTIKKELEEARKTGSMDEVFKKYCDKRPELLTYTHKVNSAVENCLADSEKPVLKTAINITESLLDFICEKDGDRLAMFIAEDGFKCLSAKQDSVQKCGADTITKNVPANLNTIPKLTEVTKEQCNEYQTVRKCIVTVLEECENKTPANIMDAFLKTIYKLSPCKTL